MKDLELVEVCSAINPVEAHLVLAALEEAGIRAELVNETLQSGIGWLPPGEATQPRIWVRREDEAVARQVIEQSRTQRFSEDADVEAGDAEPEEAPAEDAEDIAEEAAYPTLLGKLFVVGAIACTVFGTVATWRQWIKANKYSEITTAELAGAQVLGTVPSVPTPPVPNLPGGRTSGNWQTDYILYYAFSVDGREYKIPRENRPRLAKHVTVAYDPRDPEDCVLGGLMPAWMVFAGYLAAGAMLLVMGLKFG